MGLLTADMESPFDLAMSVSDSKARSVPESTLELHVHQNCYLLLELFHIKNNGYSRTLY